MVKVLIIKTSALGDIVHLYPAIKFLRKVLPQCEIDWVVERGGVPLVKTHPLVNDVFIMDSKKWRKNFFQTTTWKEVRDFWQNLTCKQYDLVFDFQGNTKSGLITLLTKAATKVGFGKKSVSERFNLLCTNFKHDPAPGLNARLEYLSLVETWIGQKAIELELTRLQINAEERQKLTALIQKKASSNIMVCPGSNWPNKQLTTTALLDFLRKLNFKGKFWLVYGTSAEQEAVQYLHGQLASSEIVEKLSLPLLQHWMGEMEQVIAMDSLPLHLAAEAGTATFAFFGASSAAKYRPMGISHRSYQGLCPYGRTFERRCPILRSCSTGACIHEVESQKLLDSFH